MKKYVYPLSLILLLATLFSCQDKIEDTYTVNTPVYLSYEDLRGSSLKVADERPIIQPGKLYFKDQTIFVNEYQKGIHVIDNADPKQPKVLKFIEIPGNVDLAIKGNILYVDSYIDLVALDITDLNNIKEVKRLEDVFPYTLPHYDGTLAEEIVENEGVVVEWIVGEKTEEVKVIDNHQVFDSWGMEPRMTVDIAAFNSASPIEGVSPGFGVGGSMARFTLYDKYLYTVDISRLKMFNVGNAANPVLESSQNIGWNIETIFPYEDKLFIGSMTGMIVYSIANPSTPEYISQFRHASSCDPVVVSGNYAYVTLRAGNFCGSVESQLDVIDISDIKNPDLIKMYPMQEPYGLGIDNSTLFVCDGNAGLKIYNATDPLKISQNLLASYPEINAFDVIPLGEVLLMIGADGLYQYDYSDLENIQQLSHIPIYSEEF